MPNSNDLYIWVQSFHTLQNYCNRGGNTNLSTYISLLPQFGSALFSSKEAGVQVLLSIYWMYKSLVFGDEFLAQGLHLKSHQRCSAGIRTWVSADQSSSSTRTESSFLFDRCLIHRGTVMLEKGTLQTVAIKLEAHNSLEYHYMHKH